MVSGYLEIAVSHLTATRYLNELVQIGLIKKERKGHEIITSTLTFSNFLAILFPIKKTFIENLGFLCTIVLIIIENLDFW